MSSGLLSSAAYKMVSTVLARRSTPVSKVAAGGRHFSAPATLAHSILKVPSTGLVSSSSGRAASTTLYAVRAFVAATAGKQSGTVKFFNSTKGLGFITPADGSADVFVHQTEIHAEGFRSLGDGEEVEFDVQGGSDGKIRAINVTGPDGAYVKGADQSARGHRGGGYGGGDGFGGGDYNY